MKYKFIFLFILIHYEIPIYSQSSIPNIEWQKSFGGSASEIAKSIVQTPDGGYITTGFSKSSDGNATINHGDNDFWVVKMSATGTLEWQKTLGGSGDDQANSICTTSDGGYVIAGYTTSSNGDITLNQGYADYWIVKLNALGNIEWQKTYGGQNQDIATSVKQTTDGGYIVGGHSSSNSGNVTGNHGSYTYDYWVIKLDSSGNLQWQKALGGSGEEFAYDIKQTTDGGYIIAGETSSQSSGDISGTYLGVKDSWIVKLGTTGTIIWEKRFGGIGTDITYSVAQTSDGGYIASGTTTSNIGNSTYNGQGDFWIIKLDTAGNLQWQNAMGSLSYDQAYSVAQTPDGNFVAAGYISSNTGIVEPGLPTGTNYWIVKLNNSGNLLWNKVLGGDGHEIAWSIISTTDGGLAVAGYSSTNPDTGDVTGNHGQSDFWIVKLSGSKESLGITESTTPEKPQIYPNPAKDIVHINHLPKESTVTVFDAVGRKISSKKYSETSISIDTSPFANGMYILQIDSAEKNILSEKLIIKK